MGRPSGGLRVVGNDQASIRGVHDTAGGINIGPARTFGDIAGRDLAGMAANEHDGSMTADSTTSRKPPAFRAEGAVSAQGSWTWQRVFGVCAALLGSVGRGEAVNRAGDNQSSRCARGFRRSCDEIHVIKVFEFVLLLC
ncbi:hypothetical protein GCM10023166_03920 [Paeniglutamicibacter cryotolerans]